MTQQQVGGAAGDVDRGTSVTWSERGDEDEHRDRDVVAHVHGSSGAGRFGDEHDHGVERREVDVRIDLDLLVEVGVGLADAGDVADRDPLG